jgi:multiple sugar transport system permease protein
MSDRTVPLAPARPARRLSMAARGTIFAWALVLPALVVVLGLVAWPFGFAIMVAFTDRLVGTPGNWVGFANFAYLMGQPSFQASVWNTVVIVVVSGFLKLGIGLGLALLVHQNLPGRGIIRSVLMLPWAMPAFVAFLTWRVLYQPIGGGINLVIEQLLGEGEVIDWLGARATAMPAVIAAATWRGFPFWFISILAALQQVPQELHDAAKVDGANAWQRFWAVTEPGIRPVVIVTILLSSIWTANSFEHVWLLTQGGPSDSTMVFPVLAYFGMQTQRLGEAAAVSIAMLPVLLVLVFVATGFLARDEDK